VTSQLRTVPLPPDATRIFVGILARMIREGNFPGAVRIDPGVEGEADNRLDTGSIAQTDNLVTPGG